MKMICKVTQNTLKINIKISKILFSKTLCYIDERRNRFLILFLENYEVLSFAKR
jgi:hypothetical protein